MNTRLRHLPASLLCIAVAACGGGGGSGGSGSGVTGPTGDDVQDTLNNLNVDTSQTERVDGNDNPLPDSYTPLGTQRALELRSELFLAGLPLSSATDQVNILKFRPGISNVPGVPNTPDRTEKLPMTSLDTQWKSGTQNAAAVGDIDGDGFQEVVQLWQNPTTSAIRLRVIDDQEENFVESPISTLITADPTYLKVETGDFSGNGADDIAIAIVDDATGEIAVHFLSGDKINGYGIDASLSKTFTATQINSTLGVEFKAGQLDRDAGAELALVTNETWGSGTNGSPANGESRYYVYDDVETGFAQVLTDRVSAFATDRFGNARVHTGITGTVAVGDIDADSLDEVIIAGLADSFPLRCDDVVTVQFALDDLPHMLAEMGAGIGYVRVGGNNCESSANGGWTTHLWADTLNIDDDEHKEIQVNGVVYDDFVNAATLWEPMRDVNDQVAEVDRLYLVHAGNNNRLRTTRENTVVTVGDVTADGRDDIIVYAPMQVEIGRQSCGSGCTTALKRPAVTVWSFDQMSGEWGMQYFEELTAFSNPSNGAPVVLAVNVDTDSTLLKFDEGSHRLVFSEPIVHAALAAPPCHGDGTQVADVCTTTWGQGTSSGVSGSVAHELSASYHSGVSGGVSLPIIGSVGVEVEKTVGVSLRAEASLGYEIKKTIYYTTGAMEDTVVATVIPYDQYTYKILSHPVYPELVGQDMVISLPRAPRTMQIERQYYNDALVGDGVRIDSAVFSHTIGDVQSYPTRSARNRRGASYIGPVDVGSSNGNTSVEISESRVAGFTASVSVSYQTTVKATAGRAMQGYTVGSETTASLGVSTGSEAIFSGTVGDIPPESFSLDRAYRYGMFVYQQDTGAQDKPFQVINYWVE